jgi:cytochrome c oxidase assembly factor CtaG
MLAAYGLGVRRASARGASWPKARTATFVLLGVGSYVVTTLGFLGVYSPYLRWAFAAQSALLLLVVPTLIAIGRPIQLARTALGERGIRRLDAVLASRFLRLLSHPIGGPALLLVMLLLFLTPLPAEVRTHHLAVAAAQIGLPVLGLSALVPVASGEEPASGTTMAIGFLIAFFELIADALPGILLRLHTGIIGPLTVPGARPPWLPTPLRDQQLSGDVLWFLGEAIDLPFLAWLVLRWIRADAKEAAEVDARLDAQDQAQRADLPPAGQGEGQPVLLRPWWEVEHEARQQRDVDGG